MDTPAEEIPVHWFVLRDLKRRNAKGPAYQVLATDGIFFQGSLAKSGVAEHSFKTEVLVELRPMDTCVGQVEIFPL